VLKGDLLPPSVADEQVTDLLRAMPDNPGMYERIVDALFLRDAPDVPPPTAHDSPRPEQVRREA